MQVVHIHASQTLIDMKKDKYNLNKSKGSEYNSDADGFTGEGGGKNQ